MLHGSSYATMNSSARSQVLGPQVFHFSSSVMRTKAANSALLTDAFSSLRCACGAANRER
jgi:hypothetical protein